MPASRSAWSRPTSSPRRSEFSRASASAAPAYVAARDVKVRALVPQREGDCAAARAEVQDAGALGQSERALDQQLALGARDQGARVHRDLEVAKAAAAGDVGDGLAADRATADRVLHLPHLAALHRKVMVGDQPLAADAENVCEQDFGVKARGFDSRCGSRWWRRPVHPRRCARPACCGHAQFRLRTRHVCQTPAWASRRRRFSSACSAAVSSSSAPFEDLVEVVDGELDPVVGDAPLAVVVCADLLGSVPGAHL